MLGIGLFELIPVEESGALNGLGTVGLGTLLSAGAAEAAAETAAKAALGHAAAEAAAEAALTLRTLDRKSVV